MKFNNKSDLVQEIITYGAKGQNQALTDLSDAANLSDVNKNTVSQLTEEKTELLLDTETSVAINDPYLSITVYKSYYADDSNYSFIRGYL
ncbi:hypothetical protein SD80_032270 [Scytonema tolypothrichoides VB-61278]|nr:hypothetical protein SD80_032270 [Scytonema tolypothrichoides VB-61278]